MYFVSSWDGPQKSEKKATKANRKENERNSSYYDDYNAIKAEENQSQNINWDSLNIVMNEVQ